MMMKGQKLACNYKSLLGLACDRGQFVMFMRASTGKMHQVAMVTVFLPVLFLYVAVVPAAAAFSNADYKLALQKSILFFDVQRSGPLPDWQRLTWRQNSGLQDGRHDNVDLRGGYHDAGDNVKFGLPLGFTLTTLSWSVVEFGDRMQKVGELGNVLNALRWGTDYLLKTSKVENELWAQLGDPKTDHECWHRPEDVLQGARRGYKVDASRPGSDVAGETAAALAAASIAFANIDPGYSSTLLARAKKVFNFADSHRGNYKDAIGNVACPYYCSNNGYNDELLWAAAWLYKASGEQAYKNYVVGNAETMGGTTVRGVIFGWDSKYAGIQVLLSKFALSGTSEFQGYKDSADAFVCRFMPRSFSPQSGVSQTPGGLLIFPDVAGTDMQHVAATTFLFQVYSNYLAEAGVSSVNCGGTSVKPMQILEVIQQQVDYMLGKNPLGMSYMVGFGDRFPQQVHHRAASNPCMGVKPQWTNCGDSWAYYESDEPNANEATGAIVVGPDRNDNFDDTRTNHFQTEPSIYNSAPFIGVLAVLATL